MTKREVCQKFTNLSKQELNTKDNENWYAGNDVKTTITKWCRGGKTRGIRAIDGFRKKLMITDSKIPKCAEFKVKLKIRKFLRTIIPLKNVLLRFIKLILIFINIIKKNKLIKMGVNVFYLELMFILINFYYQ